MANWIAEDRSRTGYARGIGSMSARREGATDESFILAPKTNDLGIMIWA
jgi:hypothetical protein